jgi:glucan endo-1,3-alpha-glucosidase
MGKAISTLQFKYTSDGNHWYRIGESNLPERMQQILSVQPDFVEFITWNDAGESHYIGNIWPEAIAGSPDIQAYADGFNHKGWLQVISPFISAYKAGATDVSQMVVSSTNSSSDSLINGSIWYRTLLTTASCSSGIQNYEQALDAMNFAIILPQSNTTVYTITVHSNGQQIGSFAGKSGLNWQTVLGLQAGKASSQVVRVVDSSGNIVASAVGTKDVFSQSNDSTLCNWNYEVVGLS